MKYPVFLMGLMGSGKTHWGKLLAEKLGANFLDLDEYIEEQEGTSIPVIFEQFGEARFRELEAKYLRALDHSGKQVVALGGGTPCFHNNIHFIKATGFSIYLQCDIKLIVERLYGAAPDRPLIRGKSKEELADFFKAQLAVREPFYLQADKVVDGGSISEEDWGEVVGV